MVTTASGATIPVSTAQLMGGKSPLAASGLPFISPPKAPPQTAQVTVTQPPKQDQQDPWASIPMRYQPQGMGQSTFDKERSQYDAKASYELAQKYGQNADLANQRKALNQQALDIVDQADTGLGATKIADVKNILVSRFPDFFKESDFANTPSATIELNKDLINSAVQRAKQMYGSRMTQSEAMLQIQRAAPSTEMTKSALKFLLQSDNTMADYQMAQADAFGQYISRGGDPNRFEGWYAQHFPAGKALAAFTASAKQAQKTETNPPNIEDLVNKYKSKNGNAR
jgi:hypothetical protein